MKMGAVIAGLVCINSNKMFSGLILYCLSYYTMLLATFTFAFDSLP